MRTCLLWLAALGGRGGCKGLRLEVVAIAAGGLPVDIAMPLFTHDFLEYLAVALDEARPARHRVHLTAYLALPALVLLRRFRGVRFAVHQRLNVCKVLTYLSSCCVRHKDVYDRPIGMAKSSSLPLSAAATNGVSIFGGVVSFFSCLFDFLALSLCFSLCSLRLLLCFFFNFLSLLPILLNCLPNDNKNQKLLTVV